MLSRLCTLMIVAALLVPAGARMLEDSMVVMAVMANNTALVERLMTAIPDRTEPMRGVARSMETVRTIHNDDI